MNELSEIVDSMASVGEANLLRLSNGIIRPLPGGNGPVNLKRMEELSSFLETLQNALSVNSSSTSGTSSTSSGGGQDDIDTRQRIESFMSLLNEVITLLSDEKRREESKPLLEEVSSVVRMVAVDVLEKRGSRAMRSILNLSPVASS